MAGKLTSVILGPSGHPPGRRRPSSAPRLADRPRRSAAAPRRARAKYATTRIARWPRAAQMLGPAGLERALEGAQRRVEREDRGDDLNDVVGESADGPRGDQRQERDRQRDHEREQRAGADLARRRADRGAEGRERRRRRRRSRGSRAGPAPSRARRTARARRASRASRPARPRSRAATFSASSALRDSRLRVRRGKAFSSRSSASEPATSRTVTNISVTVAATAIANESSDGAPPLTTCFSTSIGCATAPSSGSATSRFSSARRAKRDHLVELRLELLRGPRAAAPRARPRCAARPRISIVSPTSGISKVPPCDQGVEVHRRLLGDLLRRRSGSPR